MGIIETIKMITREEGIEEGIEKGIEKGHLNVAKSLLVDTDFNDQMIAKLCMVEESEVKQMRQDLIIE